MATAKIELIGGAILAGLFAGGQLIAHKLGIGYEAGCLISLTPVLIGSGLIGISNMIKSRNKVVNK